MKDRCFPDTLQGQMTTEWSVLENSWIRAIGENCGIQAVSWSSECLCPPIDS